MAKVTSKLQVTIPKAVADSHGIEPGTELAFESADETIRVRILDRRDGAVSDEADRQARIRAFDESTERQRARDRSLTEAHPELVEAGGRGWSRADLYGGRGVAR